MTIDLFANFGQFVYDDANPDNPLGRSQWSRRTPMRFCSAGRWARNSISRRTCYFQLAPTLYNYTGHGDTFNGLLQVIPTPDGPARRSLTLNQTAHNSLLVFELPVEFGCKVGELPMRIFGDFAANLEADDRAAAAGHPDEGDQRSPTKSDGYRKIESQKRLATPRLLQHVEQYALDPNLVDSDIFDSRVNMEGVVVSSAIALSDAVTFNLSLTLRLAG